MYKWISVNNQRPTDCDNVYYLTSEAWQWKVIDNVFFAAETIATSFVDCLMQCL